MELRHINHYKILFIILLFSFFIAVLLQASKPHIIFWDEAVYIGMGKYIYSLGNAGLWEPLRPVFLPLLLGLIWRLTEYFYFAELVMIFFSIGYALMTYLITAKMFGRRSAAFAGIFVLLTPIFFSQTGLFLTDIASGFFLLLSVYLFLNKNLLLSGAAAGLAFLTRFPHGLAAIVIMAFLAYGKRWKELSRFLSGLAIPAFFFFLANFILYGVSFASILKPLLLASMHQSNPFAPTGGFLFYLGLFSDNFLLIFALFGLFIYFKSTKNANVNLVLFLMGVYVLYFSIIPNKQLRFVLAFLGLIAVFAGYGAQLFLRKSRLFFLLLILVGSYLSLSAEYDYAAWRSDAVPFSEYYSFIGKINGTILTADPVPAAYTNNLFIPYYYSVREGFPIARERINQSKAIVYLPGSLPCLPDDALCFEVKRSMEALFLKNKLVFNASYYGKHYYVYKVI